MKYLVAILDALVGFVQRNPLTVLLVLVLAVGAPWLLKGVAMFIFYGMLFFILFVVALSFYFRWKISRIQRQMNEEFSQGGYRQRGFRSSQQPPQQEGDVKIYATSSRPEKRVAKDVGDYVEFEETKE